jgi:hypothetical protein
MIQTYLYAGIQPKEGQLEQNYSQILPPVMATADNIIKINHQPLVSLDCREAL